MPCKPKEATYNGPQGSYEEPSSLSPGKITSPVQFAGQIKEHQPDYVFTFSDSPLAQRTIYPSTTAAEGGGLPWNPPAFPHSTNSTSRA